MLGLFHKLVLVLILTDLKLSEQVDVYVTLA